MPPVVIADRYHVLRELGRGGMGVVYQVLHKDTGEQHALKVLLGHKSAKGDSVERFRRELKLPARIGSEHVVHVTDSGEVREEDGAPFYVMELLRGCDLRKLLDTQHVFTPREIVWILRQLAAGLSRAHEIGIVHRDLKPDNIFLHYRDDGRLVVKILDFGIARYAQDLLDTGDKEKLTATQAMLGTPLYMAPEQAKGGEGRAEIGPCTDIWAVGMIVFELLTGKPYWNAESLVAHLGQLLFAAMAPASQRGGGLPAGFDAWFARSCNRDSSGRFPSVAEQLSALSSLLSTAATDAEAPAELLAAVERQLPPLVDHRGATMNGGAGTGGSGAAPWRDIEEPETRILPQNRPLLGSSEQNLRAELVQSRESTPLAGGVGADRLRSRAVMAGAGLLGVGVMVLILLGNRGGSVRPSSRQSADMAAAAVGTAPRVSPPEPPPPEPAPNPTPLPASPTGAHPPAPEAKRPSAGKPTKPAEPKTKPRRTYVPPTL